MVKITCWTKEADYASVEWPRTVAQTIHPGDWVEEVHGKRKLKVKSITHVEFNGEPRLRVELGK